MRNSGWQFRRLLGGASFIVAAAVSMAAAAQSYPNKPITNLIPNPAGSQLEVTFRAICAEASKLLGQPVVSENRAGANGRLGLMAIRNAPADGYLVTIASDSTLVAQPSADPAFLMEEGKQYQPMVFLFEFPLVLAGRTTLPFRDVRGLLQYARANPGKLNWATSPGTMFMTDRIRQTAGIEMTSIPYKGATPSLVDVVAGRLDVVIAGPDVASFFDAGKLIGIATTGRDRWRAFPALPTLTEGGIPVTSTVWYGLIAAAGTPPDVIAKLNGAFNAALRNPAITKLMESNGFSLGSYQSPREFSAFIQSELTAWRPIIQKSGIKLE